MGVLLTIPYSVEIAAYCEHTDRLALVDRNWRMSMYSMRNINTAKFTVPFEHEISIIRTGHKWQDEEACMFVAGENELFVVSCVDGAILQSVQLPSRVKSMVYNEGLILLLFAKNVYILRDIDGFIANDIAEVDPFTLYFSIVSVPNVECINDIAMVSCRAWPFNRVEQQMLVSVGSGESALILTPVAPDGTGILSKLSSLILSPSLFVKHVNDNAIFGEEGRSFSKVQVFDDKIFCLDDDHGRLVLFDAHTLLVDRILKGIRGGVVVDSNQVFHPRTFRLLDIRNENHDAKKLPRSVRSLLDAKSHGFLAVSFQGGESRISNI